jgi:hypothetical protein
MPVRETTAMPESARPASHTNDEEESDARYQFAPRSTVCRGTI